MRNSNLRKLAEIIRARQEDLMRLWRDKARQVPAARHLDTATLDDHIRMLLGEITKALVKEQTRPMVTLKIDGGSANHGLSRLHQDFNVVELVAEYNALREAIQEFAETNRISIAGQVNAIVNRVLDKAVAIAVQTYSEEKALEIQQQREEHLSFIVHDLKTPLAAASIAANILDQALPYQCKDERVSRMMELVHRNVHRLSALVSRVLQENANIHAARETGGAFPAKVEVRELDLWPLVEELIHDLQPLIGTKDIQIKNEVPHDCIVFGDPVLLNQVFQNLLSNAIDHTSKGEIVVGAVGALSKPEGAVHCWVRDTGEGIPETRINKIFDKLETDPRKKGGLGLGLAVVKQIVEAHGGEITVASQESQGSIFNFHLPAHIDIERAS